MRKLQNFILFNLLIVLSCSIYAQNNSKKLKKEQIKLEKKISNTKMLLNKTKNEADISLQDLQLIDNQIKNRERLLRNYDKQIRFSEQQIAEKKLEINNLQTEQKQLKEQFKEMMIYAYKKRNKYGQLMYVFSSDSYNEAIKRNNYLVQIKELRLKQFDLLKKNKEAINAQIIKINVEKNKKIELLSEKIDEKKKIEEDRIKQEVVFRKFKKQEDLLSQKLNQEIAKRNDLKKKINDAIKSEIKAEQARIRLAEEKRRKELAKNKNNTSNKNTSVLFKETKESALLGKNFSSNKGKLPWPVEKGSITEKFGKNLHPTLHNVYTNNNGIDISAPKNSQVRCVFAGKVTSVLNIPGAGKVIIVKHGAYRTVYGNLKDTYVKAGDKLKIKQTLGSLLSKNNSNISLAHFEIHVVSGTNIKCLNPSIWIAR